MTPKQKQDAFEAAQKQHRQQLMRLSERGGAQKMHKLYRRAQAEIAQKLRATVRRGDSKSYTADKHRVTLALITEGETQLTHQLTKELGGISRDASEDGLRSGTATIAKLSKDFDHVDVSLPVEEASRFAGVIQKRRTSLLTLHESSMQRYGADLIGTMEGELSQSLLQQETPLEAIGRVEKVAQNEWWQAERIVRSESSWAFNASHHDAIKEAQSEIPDLMMQWQEHISLDGVPLDDRVAADSEALHLQIASPGGRFFMPLSAENVSEKLKGQSWEAPPNRPNDRAVLSPWRKDWGQPGWQMLNGVARWVVPIGGE